MTINNTPSPESAPPLTSANGAAGGPDPQAVEQSAQGHQPHVPTLQEFQDLANAYMVPMSEQTLESLAQNAQPEALEQFAQYVKTSAAGLYPTLAKQIMAGIPTDLLVDPYRQVAQQVLGSDIEPDFIGDPKSAAALSGGFDPSTGRPAPMSLSQWKQHIKETPEFGWQNSPEAQARAQQIIQAINSGFSQGPQAGGEE